MKTLLFILSVLFISVPAVSFSQVSTSDTTKQKQIVVITKNDGNQYTGVILSDDGREILIETQTLGKIYIPKADIKSIVKVEDATQVVNGEFQPTGPFTTRYSFTTNALPIKKGENYTMINLYGPEVHFALSDHFNLGVMTTWVGSPLVLAAKYSFATNNEKLNFSIGSLNGTSGYLNNFRGFGGLHFANVTLGDRNKNITFGVGYAYMKTGRLESRSKEGVYYDSLGFNGTNYLYNDQTELVPRFAYKGPVFSFAGIIKSGARASFILDGILGVFSRDYIRVIQTEITPPSNSPPYAAGYYKFEGRRESTTNLALILMPGMRFQKTDQKAFQVSIAGITWQTLKGDAYGNKSSVSFPFPMCSWFYKF
ncbi:MAG: hypothetical protein M3R17_13535 [Bacteroidota bacterium]|nr:hypothetical protein [Bacteroidota bacterium]